MKPRLSNLPIQLFAFLILPLLVLLLVVSLGSVALHQSTMRDTLAAHNMQIVSGSAATLSEQIMKRQMTLQQISSNLRDSDQSYQLTNTFFDGGVALYTPEGSVLAASSQNTDWDALWQTVRESHSEIIPLITPGENSTRILLRSTVPNSETAIGIVSLPSLGIVNILSGLESSDAAAVYIVTANGQILYHSDPSQIGEFVPGFQAGETTGRFEFRTNQRGQDVLATIAPIPDADWTLVQEEQWKNTLSPLMRYSQMAPLVLIPGLLLTVLALWLGVQQIVYPLRQLENQATSLDWGNVAAVEQPVGGIEEIQQLQATLRHMVQRIQKSQSGMHNYIAAITQAQEDERLRLARELHDQTAQSLVALNHRVQMLIPYLKDESEVNDLVSETRSMIMQTINELRRIVRALRPIYLEELGLAPALEMLTRDLDLNEQTKVQFQKTGSAQRLKPANEIALYRIAQEALNNAWQHSAATMIWLSVQFEDEYITISVRDDGQGFTAPRHAIELTETAQEHFGIVGMYERAALIGAHLQIQSEPGSGTTITVRAAIQ